MQMKGPTNRPMEVHTKGRPVNHTRNADYKHDDMGLFKLLLNLHVILVDNILHIYAVKNIFVWCNRDHCRLLV